MVVLTLELTFLVKLAFKNLAKCLFLITSDQTIWDVSSMLRMFKCKVTPCDFVNFCISVEPLMNQGLFIPELKANRSTLAFSLLKLILELRIACDWDGGCCWRAPSIFLQSSFHSNVVHVVHTSQNERWVHSQQQVKIQNNQKTYPKKNR